MKIGQVRRWRLGAAFVLLTYVVLHFLNHALGLVSLAAMEAGRWWFLRLWRSPVGTVALYGALGVHGGLALWLLYQRRTLRMPAWEATQYGSASPSPHCWPPTSSPRGSRGGGSAPTIRTRGSCSASGCSPRSGASGRRSP